MNRLAAPDRPDATGVRITDVPEGLSRIHKPGCAATIWQRTPLPVFQSWIDSLAPEHLPRARLILRPEYVRDALTKLTCTCGMPDCAEKTMLVDDAAALAMIFARITRAPFLRLRLDVATDAKCQEFHLDAVKARLVCAYRGSGMELCTLRDGGTTDRWVRVPTGAPIVLRGGLWPDHLDTNCLQRTFPAETTDDSRLVLVLDPVADADPISETTHIH